MEDVPPLLSNDLSLIGELPHALGLLAEAPRPLQEVIAAAFDIRCVYRPEIRQATVVVTITDATPGIIDALLADPRTDDSDAATGTAAFRDMAHTPLERRTVSLRTAEASPADSLSRGPSSCETDTPEIDGEMDVLASST